MQTLAPATATVDSTLATVLARPEFAPPPPRPLFGLVLDGLSWVWSRLGDLVQWLVPEMEGTGAMWGLAGRLLLLGLALVAMVLLLRAFLPVLGRLGRRSGPAGPRPREERVLTGEEWEERARLAASEGRWRDASLALYRAVILRLAESREVDPDPAKTPGDYRREIRGGPAAPVLDAFLRHFEPVAFGRSTADPETYRHLVDLASALGARG